jgi:hypothetical protein
MIVIYNFNFAVMAVKHGTLENLVYGMSEGPGIPVNSASDCATDASGVFDTGKAGLKSLINHVIDYRSGLGRDAIIVDMKSSTFVLYHQTRISMIVEKNIGAAAKNKKFEAKISGGADSSDNIGRCSGCEKIIRRSADSETCIRGEGNPGLGPTIESIIQFIVFHLPGEQ